MFHDAFEDGMLTGSFEAISSPGSSLVWRVTKTGALKQLPSSSRVTHQTKEDPGDEVGFEGQ